MINSTVDNINEMKTSKNIFNDCSMWNKRKRNIKHYAIIFSSIEKKENEIVTLRKSL